MKRTEIKELLHRYFNGETTLEEEKSLEIYFRSEEIDEEFKEYAEFFGGISELAGEEKDSSIADDIMDYILENEHQEKTKFRKLWVNVTGIAASVIIVLGGFLFYQQQKSPFKDTFENPEEAYVYAEQTLKYMSGKYNKGLAELANFEKLNAGDKPLKKGVTPVNEFFENITDTEENK